MTMTTYVAVFPEVRRDDVHCRVHAPECKDLDKARANRSVLDTVALDLDAEDHTANMLVLDPDELGYEWSDVVVLRCATNLANKVRRQANKERREAEQARTAGRTSRKTAPRSRNGKAADSAVASAEKIVKDEVAKVVARRDTPTRLATCDDETYAKAVQVRELRATGAPWWRIAHQMGLPGSGPSVAQGKTGAAHARRLWERAWGKTYSDTSVPRDTKERKKERALTTEARPFFTADTMEMEIVSAITGKKITWFTRLEANGNALIVSEQEAIVYPKDIQVLQGAKGRVVSFYEVIKDERGTEMVGPRRSVYIDRIEKVGL